MPLILDPGLGSCSSLLPGVDVHWGSRERAGVEVSMVKRMEIRNLAMTKAISHC